MNKISEKILKYINNNDKYKNEIIVKRHSFTNVKDFTNQVGYIIMDIVSREKKFFDVDRRDIDVNAIAQELF